MNIDLIVVINDIEVMPSLKISKCPISMIMTGNIAGITKCFVMNISNIVHFTPSSNKFNVHVKINIFTCKLSQLFYYVYSIDAIIQ